MINMTQGGGESQNGNLASTLPVEDGFQVADRQNNHKVNSTVGRCGWFCFVPSCLQVFHTTKWLLAFLSVMTIIQGAVINGMVSSSLTMLEKRFDLSSTHVGVLGSGYDIGVLLALLVVTYIGGKGHKGRWIAVGTVIMGVGSLNFALPQFTTGTYEYDPVSDPKCIQGQNQTSTCDESRTSLRSYFWWFLVAQLLHGIGASPMFTLTYVYLDENVEQKNSAVYTSLLYVASIIGPSIGYLGSGQLLKIYGDIGKVDPSSVDLLPDDPRWYGAWWLGVLACGILAPIVALPIGGYARQLPNAETYHKSRANEAQSGTVNDISGKSHDNPCHDFFAAVRNLFRNTTYIFCVLSDTMESFVVGSFITFAPKYLENVFSLTASSGSFIAGAIAIGAAGGGSMFSGILMHKLNMDCRTMLKYCCVCLILSVLAAATLFLGDACDNVSYAGITVDYITGEQRDSSADLDAPCNLQCECSNEIYQPVCGTDGTMYYSPCLAGCTQQLNSSTYGDCACLLDAPSTVVKGKCPSSCTLMPLYLVVLFLTLFLTFMVATPQIQIILRCVPYSQRSLATGGGWVSARLLGSIPGPIIFGLLFDSSCMVWGQKCNQETSCIYYNSKTLAWRMALMTVSIKLISAICGSLAWLFYKPDQEKEVDVTKEQYDNVVVAGIEDDTQL